jgi:hypothetical protein
MMDKVIDVYCVDEGEMDDETRWWLLSQDFENFVIPEEKEALEAMGFWDVDIRWDVSFSQGSGCSFVGKVTPLDWIVANKRVSAYRTLVKWLRDGYGDYMTIYAHNNHYVHEYTMQIDWDDCNRAYPEVYDTYGEEHSNKLWCLWEKMCEDLSEEILEQARQRMKTLHRKMEDMAMEYYKQGDNHD